MIYDAIIVGGSFAGLTAAMQLARARRKVLIIDGGLPRNRFSSHSHGVFALEGRPGTELIETARVQVLSYPTASFKNGWVQKIEKGSGTFDVIADLNGESKSSDFQARKILLATGIVDNLPEIPGLKERWGRTVLHCPYCHGYEIGGGSIGVIATNPLSAHQATHVADWGDVTLFTDGKIELDEETKKALKNRKVKIESTPIARLEGTAPELSSVLLTDGRQIPVRAAFVAASQSMASPLAKQLGCEFEDAPLGPLIRTDMWKLTSVPGVYAAGDIARMQQNIAGASSDGALAGIALHRALIQEEIMGDN